jgi:hypothetical protein
MVRFEGRELFGFTLWGWLAIVSLVVAITIVAMIMLWPL